MGRWLRAAGYLPDQVLCSTARRARETWQLVQAGLGAAPPASFDDGVYQGSAVQLLDLIRRANPAAGTLLVVGHDPALPELALALAATTPVAYPGAASDIRRTPLRRGRRLRAAMRSSPAPAAGGGAPRCRW